MFVRLKALFTYALVTVATIEGADCEDANQSICLQNKSMNEVLCNKYSGKIVSSCMEAAKDRFKFQCRIAEIDNSISILNFDERFSAIQASSICGELKGKLKKAGAIAARKPDMKRGKILYAEKGCVTCHGSNGKGNGPISAALLPKPNDLTLGLVRGIELSSIIQVINDGISGTSMAPYAGVLDDNEIADLAIYIQYLARKTKPLPGIHHENK